MAQTYSVTHQNRSEETSELFKAVKLSASTASFELEDFVYIWM